MKQGERTADQKQEFLATFLEPSIAPSNTEFNNVYDLDAFRRKDKELGGHYTNVPDEEIEKNLFSVRQKSSPYPIGPRDFGRQLRNEKAPGRAHAAFDAGITQAVQTFTRAARGYAQREINESKLAGTEPEFAQTVLDSADAVDEWFANKLDHSQKDSELFTSKAVGVIAQMGSWIGASLVGGALGGAGGFAVGGPVGAFVGAKTLGWGTMASLAYGVHADEAAERAIAAGATPGTDSSRAQQGAGSRRVGGRVRRVYCESDTPHLQGNHAPSHGQAVGRSRGGG